MILPLLMIQQLSLLKNLLCSSQSFFLFFILGGLSIWAISPEERNKHDQKFDTLSPLMGYVSGNILLPSADTLPMTLRLHLMKCTIVEVQQPLFLSCRGAGEKVFPPVRPTLLSVG